MWKYCNNSWWMPTRSINTWNDICKLVSLFGWRTTHSRFSWNTCYHQKLQTSQLSWFIQICNSRSTFSIFKVVFAWSVSKNYTSCAVFIIIARGRWIQSLSLPLSLFLAFFLSLSLCLSSWNWYRDLIDLALFNDINKFLLAKLISQLASQ